MKLSECFVIKNFSKKDFEKMLTHCQKTYSKYNVKSSSPFHYLEMVPNLTPTSFDDIYVYKDRQVEIGARFELIGCSHNNFNFDVIVLNGDLYIGKSPYYYGQYTATSLFKDIQSQTTPSLNSNGDDSKQSYKEWTSSQFRGGNIYAENNYKTDKDILSKLGIEV